MNEIREAWEGSLAKKICGIYPKEIAPHKAVFEEGYQAALTKKDGGWTPMSVPLPLETPLLFLYESGGIIHDVITVETCMTDWCKGTEASGPIIAWRHEPDVLCRRARPGSAPGGRFLRHRTPARPG